jgi:tetratricopeptide (TPR) repeat protein
MEGLLNNGAATVPRAGLSSVDEVVKEMKKIPFFMTELDDDVDEDNQFVDALKALVYDGEPHEIAMNFKNQGNDCFKEKKYGDAISYYTRALDVHSGVDGIDVACYTNRAACNLELRNYRRCINDCKLALAKDPTNVKAVYRSARAYLAVDKIDEALDIASYGLSLDPSNLTLLSVSQSATNRKNTLAELQRKKEAEQRLREQKQNNLKMGLESRNLTVINTGHKQEESLQGLKVVLEDDLDPGSALTFPLIFLYPLELETDLIQYAAENSTIANYLEEVFASPPHWFEHSAEHLKDYALPNLAVYAQTTTGGLVKVGKNSTLIKVLSLKKPIIPIIDNVARLYIVPQNRDQEWLSSWNKDQALRQMGLS